MFEQLKIGPLLHCCMFKRSIIDIMLEENIICSTIIFSGILCKRFPYYKIKADMFYTYFGYMNNLQNKDSECLPKIVSEYDKNWIEYTQNKINAYCLNAQNQQNIIIVNI